MEEYDEEVHGAVDKPIVENQSSASPSQRPQAPYHTASGSSDTQAARATHSKPVLSAEAQAEDEAWWIAFRQQAALAAAEEVAEEGRADSDGNARATTSSSELVCPTLYRQRHIKKDILRKIY